MSGHTLDASNLLRPLPVISKKTRNKAIADGDVLKVICTDPGALQDIPAWSRINGHHVVEPQQGARETVITIRIAKPEGTN